MGLIVYVKGQPLNDIFPSFLVQSTEGRSDKSRLSWIFFVDLFYVDCRVNGAGH
ncbi:hypothetical protein D3C72_1378770 [compost metagenome]